MADQTTRTLLNQSVARTCVALGCKEAPLESVESLSDVLEHYIQFLAEKSNEQAEISGRVHAGLQDFIHTLSSPVRFCVP